MKFTHDEVNKTINVAENGLQVARIKDSKNKYMYIPDVDPRLGASVALHVLNGMNREHDAQFGTGIQVADILTAGEFDDEKIQRYSSSEKFTLTYSSYTETIRVKETNHMVMTKNKDDGKWQFDFDSGAPENLIQQTFLRFHALGNEGKALDGPELLSALSTKVLEKDREMDLELG